MSQLKQYLMATSLLIVALSCSLLISYWLNQNATQHGPSKMVEHSDADFQQPNVNKFKQSMLVLLPTIRLK